MTILYINDSSIEHMLFKHCIESFKKNDGKDYDVIQLLDVDAFEYIDFEKIDMMITDLRMPIMNGMQLIRIVQAKWPRVKLVLNTKESFKELCYDMTGIHFLQSPYAMDDLKKIMEGF